MGEMRRKLSSQISLQPGDLASSLGSGGKQAGVTFSLDKAACSARQGKEQRCGGKEERKMG